VEVSGEKFLLIVDEVGARQQRQRLPLTTVMTVIITPMLALMISL
jgi:hypothetical protein